MSRRSTHIRVATVLVALVLLAAQTVAQLVDYGAYHLRYAALNSDRHVSIFGIASLVANGVAAAAALSGAVAARRTIWWWSFALMTIVLASRISEIGSGGVIRYVLLFPLVAATFVVLWLAVHSDPRNARTFVYAGLGLLALSYVIHVVGPHAVSSLGYSNHSWAYEIKGVLKHDAELGGWTFIAGGLLACTR